MKDHLAQFKTLKVKHPDFGWIYKHGGHNHSGPIVVFERKTWVDPTPEQLIDFELRKTMVESLGGYMGKISFEIAGKNPVFTQADVDSMVAAVKRDLPAFEFVDKWNGLGCYTMSVAIQRKTKVLTKR